VISFFSKSHDIGKDCYVMKEKTYASSSHKHDSFFHFCDQVMKPATGAGIKKRIVIRGGGERKDMDYKVKNYYNFSLISFFDFNAVEFRLDSESDARLRFSWMAEFKTET